MKKWLLAVLAISCFACGVACSNNPQEESSSESVVVELPDVSTEELIEINTVPKMLKENETLCITFSDRGNKSVLLVQNVWYYSYVNGELQVDYRAKENGNETKELGTYCDGVYYGLRDKKTFAQIYPEQDFFGFVSSFLDLSIEEKDFEESDLRVVGNELLLNATSTEADGFHYTWIYRFEKETHALTKATALVYKSNGTYVKTREILFERNKDMEWERAAYKEVKETEEETVEVTAHYVEDGAVTHKREMTLLKERNLYAKDMHSDLEYCMYADAACTQMLVDLRHVTGDTTNLYVSAAKEGDLAVRDLKIAQRDSDFERIMEAYGKYYVSYKEYNLREECIGEQYWYYDDHRPEEIEDEDGTAKTRATATEDVSMTFDYWEKDKDGKVVKVVNFREPAFYTWMAEENTSGRFEFALLLDKDYQSVLYAYGTERFGTHTIKTPMTQE